MIGKFRSQSDSFFPCLRQRYRAGCSGNECIVAAPFNICRNSVFAMCRFQFQHHRLFDVRWQGKGRVVCDRIKLAFVCGYDRGRSVYMIFDNFPAAAYLHLNTIRIIICRNVISFLRCTTDYGTCCRGCVVLVPLIGQRRHRVLVIRCTALYIDLCLDLLTGSDCTAIHILNVNRRNVRNDSQFQCLCIFFILVSNFRCDIQHAAFFARCINDQFILVILSWVDRSGIALRRILPSNIRLSLSHIIIGDRQRGTRFMISACHRPNTAAGRGFDANSRFRRLRCRTCLPCEDRVAAISTILECITELCGKPCWGSNFLRCIVITAGTAATGIVRLRPVTV